METFKTSLLRMVAFVKTAMTKESLMGNSGCEYRWFLTDATKKDGDISVWKRNTGNAMACQSSGSASTRQCRELSLDQMYSTQGTDGRAWVNGMETFNPMNNGLVFPSCDVFKDKIDVVFGQLESPLHVKLTLTEDSTKIIVLFCNSDECVLLCWYMLLM